MSFPRSSRNSTTSEKRKLEVHLHDANISPQAYKIVYRKFANAPDYRWFLLEAATGDRVDNMSGTAPNLKLAKIAATKAKRCYIAEKLAGIVPA